MNSYLKKARIAFVSWGAATIAIPVACWAACSDNAPFTCHTGGCTPSGTFCVEVCTSDGTGSQCISGYGGAGANCTGPVYYNCNYTEWNRVCLLGDGPSQPASHQYGTTVTDGTCTSQ